MHSAFKTRDDKYFMSGGNRAPLETFRRLLGLVEIADIDAVLLTGDIVNYPHNASVQHVRRLLQEGARRLNGESPRHVPVLYTPGNHDWLIEGLQQSRRSQVSAAQAVLAPLSRRSLECGALELQRGDRKLLLVILDNSMLEVSEEQLLCLRRALGRGLPAILAVHVPFLLPGMAQPKEVLCGDPRYSQAGDRGWQVERRERWPPGGASAATARLLDELPRLAAPRGPLLAVLAGHEHLHRADVLGPPCLACPEREGLVQYVSLPGFEGGHRIVQVRDERS